MTVTHSIVVDHVHDGDTLSGTITLSNFLGQKTTWYGRVRLITVNAPELKTPEGDAALAYVEALIAPGDTVATSAPRDYSDQFGRLLADIIVAGKSLSQDLLDTGNAKPMTGKTAKKEFGVVAAADGGTLDPAEFVKSVKAA